MTWHAHPESLGFNNHTELEVACYIVSVDNAPISPPPRLPFLLELLSHENMGIEQTLRTQSV